MLEERSRRGTVTDNADDVDAIEIAARPFPNLATIATMVVKNAAGQFDKLLVFPCDEESRSSIVGRFQRRLVLSDLPVTELRIARHSGSLRQGATVCNGRR